MQKNYLAMFGLLTVVRLISDCQATSTEIINPHFSHSSKQGVVTTFDDVQSNLSPLDIKIFDGQDPYDLDDEFHKFYKKQNFKEASWFFIASAINGHLDNLDFLTKFDPLFQKYVLRDSLLDLESLQKKLAEHLCAQQQSISRLPKKVLPKIKSEIVIEALK